MSKLKAGNRSLRRPSRTTVSIDGDTAAALAYLRSWESAEKVSASRLLRDSARTALAEQGKRVVAGEVVPE